MNIYFKKLILFSLLVFSIGLKAQDLKIVKKSIEDLCSKEIAGRGYTSHGDSLASAYIANVLKKNKLKAFAGNYFQPFRIPVNTFPGKIEFAINDSVLIPGRDYLINETSCSINGKFPVIIMNHNLVDFPEKFDKISGDLIKASFILIDTVGVVNSSFKKSIKNISENNSLGAKGIIQLEYKKLMQVPSSIVQSFPTVVLNKSAVPEHLDSVAVCIENKYVNNYQTKNVAAFLRGKIDTFIVFSAHYDHLGEMGKGIYFPGANDNASGTTMVLELAKYLSKNKKKLKYSYAFLFFSGEELGLLGSFNYVNNPVFPLSKIKFLINLDMVGSGDKGIKVVNGTEHKKEFNTLVSLNKQKDYLPEIGIRGPAANSDHFPFHQKGVKCFFIYTLGQYSEYHSIYDEPKALPLSKFSELFNLMLDFTKTLN